jgi:hypothetical protein
VLCSCPSGISRLNIPKSQKSHGLRSCESTGCGAGSCLLCPNRLSLSRHCVTLNCPCARHIRLAFSGGQIGMFQTATQQSTSEQDDPGYISVPLAEDPVPKACGIQSRASTSSCP